MDEVIKKIKELSDLLKEKEKVGLIIIEKCVVEYEILARHWTAPWDRSVEVENDASV